MLPNKRSKRNIIVDIMFCDKQLPSFKDFYPKELDYEAVHDLIFLLSSHRDFKKLIDTPRPLCPFDDGVGEFLNKFMDVLYTILPSDPSELYTIRQWLNQYGLDKTKALLACY
ncbi:MAG: hypothetical protein NMK33_05235 [Candidatus Cardinium sp.]|uniref:hypothetical protein n=1 Tax=Cardinium endosymbiont of Dermatophagoides farinae TaxID=2597823 RepID=UPI001181E12B|nr:hypothetical protein [Cardinium endosymbiont of Dermatophagoides farinae]TSJ80819.1 hypothetical protein FPG78_02030 [Cardinium endosymbiont of Dermatophagoides farinae]UWW96822.1 MAG: hypothetical protein NMK33_05235 [Candidatus Cardinium sp.]